MKKLLSLVSLFSLIFGSFGLGMQTANSQPLNFTADTTIRFAGLSNRELVIKAGSYATSYVINQTNMIVTTAPNGIFKVEDLGRTSPNNEKRIISSSDGTQTTCSDNGSILVINSSATTVTITISPSDQAVNCGGGSVAGGGGASSVVPAPVAPAVIPTPTPAPTPADAVYVFKEGKIVPVTKEEAAKIEAEAATKEKAEVKPKEVKKDKVKAPAVSVEPTEKPAVEALKPAVPQPAPKEVTAARQEQVQTITNIEAPALAQADTIAEVVQNLGVTRDEKKEDKAIENTIPKLDIDLTSLFAPTAAPAAPATGKVAISAKALETVVAFVAYGTDTTEKIGEGERAGVLNSYIAACGKAPQNEDEWADVLKISAGRFPAEKCTKTASRAQTNFQRVYNRTPKADSASDQAAITMMQFGLLPVKAVKTDEGAKIVPNRDVAKEKKAITVFRGIFKFSPKAPTAWSVVRAIAYSGAKR